MFRYYLLLQYTEIGISQIQDTTRRASDFVDVAKQMGVAVESLAWTLGEYDGVITLAAEEEESIIALTTHLARKGYVRTCLLRAFTETEFEKILSKMPDSTIVLDA